MLNREQQCTRHHAGRSFVMFDIADVIDRNRDLPDIHELTRDIARAEQIFGLARKGDLLASYEVYGAAHFELNSR